MFSVLSPSGSRGRLSTLIFHRVLAQNDPLFPEELDARRFDAICGWVNRWFNVLPLDEAARRLRDGNLPARALAITFDDGYDDNHRIALPILRRHGLTATFFVASGFLDGGRMWNDTIIEAVRRTRRPCLDLSEFADLSIGTLDVSSVAARRAAILTILPKVKYLAAAQRMEFGTRLAATAEADLPGDLMMTSAQVRELDQAGMQVGAHTVSHPILSRLDERSAQAEIGDGKRALERILGKPVALFAYPNGRPGDDYGEREVRLAREAGFAAAMSTAWGAAGPGTDLFQLPRFTPWRSTQLQFAAQLAQNILRR